MSEEQNNHPKFDVFDGDGLSSDHIEDSLIEKSKRKLRLVPPIPSNVVYLEDFRNNGTPAA